MIQLDLLTLSITLACVSIMAFVVLFIIWRINRELSGMLHWMIGGMLIGLAFLAIFVDALLGLDGSRGVLISNALSLPAVLFTVEGSLRFRGNFSIQRWRIFLGLIPFFVVMAWLLSEDPQLRYLFHDAVASAGLATAALILIWRVPESGELRANALAALFALLLAMAFAGRWLFALTADAEFVGGTDIPVNHWLFFALILFSIGWTFGLSVAAYYRSHQQVMQLAREDSLTGLPNRRSIDEVLKRRLAEARRSREVFAVIMLDVNRFKEVNDQFGHSAGDRVLAIIADRLLQAVRDADFAGRLGGDEFLVVARGMEDGAALQAFIQRLRGEINGSIILGDNRIEVEISVGIAIWPRDGDSVDELLGVADRQMYRDKAGLRSTI